MKLSRSLAFEALLWAVAGFLFLDRMLDAWYELVGVPLTDQLAYPQFARGSHFFFDSGEREPLHVFLVKIALAFVQPDNRALCAVGLVDTLALFFVLVLWMRLRHGLVAAVVVAIAAYGNRFLAFYGVQGFNMSTYLLTLAAFAAIADERQEPSRGRAALLGLAGGFVGLARMEGILAVAPAVVAAIAAGPGSARRKLGSLAIVALVSAAFVTPHLLYQWIEFGSPAHRLELDARWWTNTEAIGAKTLDPNASREAGGPLGLDRYVMGGGLGALASRVAAGYEAAWSRYLPRLFSNALWVLPLAALGFAYLVWERRWAVPALALSVVFPISFILPVDQIGPGSGVEMRFVLPMLVPLFALCGAGGGCLAMLGDELVRRARSA